MESGFLNFEYEICIVNSEIWNPESEIRDLKYCIWKMEYEIWVLKDKAWNTESEIRNLQYADNPNYEIENWHLKSKIWDPRDGNWHLKCEN